MCMCECRWSAWDQHIYDFVFICSIDCDSFFLSLSSMQGSQNTVRYDQLLVLLSLQQLPMILFPSNDSIICISKSEMTCQFLGCSISRYNIQTSICISFEHVWYWNAHTRSWNLNEVSFAFLERNNQFSKNLDNSSHLRSLAKW